MVDVAQLVRAPDCGSGCRGFESLLPPHKENRQGSPFFCAVFFHPSPLTARTQQSPSPAYRFRRALHTLITNSLMRKKITSADRPDITVTDTCPTRRPLHTNIAVGLIPSCRSFPHRPHARHHAAFPTTSSSRTPHTDRFRQGTKKSSTINDCQAFIVVGVTGFEPATTRPPDVYSNRTELRPDLRLQR